MNYTMLFKKIEKGDIEPLYLFYGEENFLVDEAVKKVISKAIESAHRDFNLDILSGNETNSDEIINTAKTLPFIGGRRVIIVKYRENILESGIDRLIEYCSMPSPTTCLIFTALEMDVRSKLYNTISKSGITVQFNQLNKRDASAWITKRVKEAGYRIGDYAKEYLLEIVGNNLQRLSNELEKVFIFKCNDKDININDIKFLVEDTKIESIFTFTDSLSSGDMVGALKLLNKLMNQGETSVKIIGMIARQMRLIFLTRFFKEKGIPLSELPARAGFPPFLLKGYLNLAGKYNKNELRESFFMIQNADIRLKSSDIPEKRILEKLVFDLCSR
jgi:DNA polymerase-3 subunit delta